MPDVSDQKQARVRRLKKNGLIAAGLLLLYVIIGFWVVPPILKPKLEEQLYALLGRQVTIAEIKLNPLVLSATINKLTIFEKDGKPFAGFEKLYANAQIASIIKWAFTVREIRVQEPFGVLKLLPDKKLNIDDILAKLSEPEPEPREEETGLPRAIIETFQVIDGKLSVENHTVKAPIREELAPISFTLENLSTLEGREGAYRFVGIGPLGGQFEVDGKMTVNPVRIQGSFDTTGTQLSHYWEHLKDWVSFQIASGVTKVSGDYTMEIVDGQINMRLENGDFTLDDFTLVEKGKQEVLIALPAFSVDGIGADLQEREIVVEHIQTTDARIQSWLSSDGTFELQRLFLPDIEKLMQKKKTGESKQESTPTQPWRVALKKMEVKNGEIAFEDQTLFKPAKWSADKLNVVVENLTNEKDKQASISVNMRVNQAGNVAVEGKAGVVPIQTDLNVVTDKIALKSFQPYVDDAVNAQITAGTTSSKGRVRFHGMNAKPQIRYDGEFSVDGVEIQDRVKTKDFITLAQLKASGIGLELSPNRLKVAQVLIDRPHARVTIDEAGVVNVVNAFAPVENEKKEVKEDGKENLLQRLVSYLILQFKGPMPMRVEQVQLKTFTGDFVDASISPTFGTHVEISDAAAAGLSSDPSAKADFKFTGSIDETGKFKGSGQMNPMNSMQYSKVNVSLNHFALKPVSPYSGKFIGYKIAQGTLHTDLKYQVADDTVDGDNIIVLDQLELGEPVDSPDALNLPIKLGVALLKDSEGRIKVQVPVKGSVRDPQFDFKKAIQSALTGTIENAGNAPFDAISEVDGFTGEDLKTVYFEFGFSDLQDREIKKLNALAKLLKDRKALNLGIVGTADRQMDGAAIMGKSSGKTPTSAAATPLGQATKVESVVDMKPLAQLAQQRAEKVSAYLIEQAGVEAKRIQVTPLQIKPVAAGEWGQVEFSLSVK